MKVRGTSAALVAITATLITTAVHNHANPPQVRTQAVDNSLMPVRDEISLARASRSRRLDLINKPNKTLVTTGSRSKLPLRVYAKRNVQTFVSRSTVRVNPGVQAWAHSRSAYRVANCESGDRSAADVNIRYNGDAHLRDGRYHGKWQMDADFWRSYGGLKFASDAADASESEQDAVAYKGYQARGWQPWSCSRIMGVR